ncbi:unnamed protein product [Sympodiomycopsis kandeliae]
MTSSEIAELHSDIKIVDFQTDTNKHEGDHDAKQVELEPLAELKNDAAPLSGFQKLRRTTFFNMLMIALIATAGPAMSDGINGLGGGGKASPEAFNKANAAYYAMMAVGCLVGGSLFLSRFGVRTALVAGACLWPLEGISLLITSKIDNIDWLLILAETLVGIGGALWYVGEAAVVLSYPEPSRRGLYLAWWIVSRNLGQLLAGAINLGLNSHRDSAGAVNPTVYVAFIVIELSGIPAALLLCPPEQVVRVDGSTIATEDTQKFDLQREVGLLLQVCKSLRLIMFLPFAFVSFFYISPYNTFLADYFSVRARALSSLISPFLCILGCFALAFILDAKRYNQSQRAWSGFIAVVTTCCAVHCWQLSNSAKLINHHEHPHERTIDWTDSSYLNEFFPYFLINTTGPMCQSFGFWLISCFNSTLQGNGRMAGVFRAVEAAGQGVSYGLMSQKDWNPIVGFITNFVLFGIMVGPLGYVVRCVGRDEQVPQHQYGEDEDGKETV